MDARLRNSRVTWTVSVCEGEPRLEIDLLVNFDERFTLLQMPVRLADQPSRWADGIAGGHVARSSGPTEWPFLGWSRLTVGKTNIGMVTNDAYSHSVNGRLWQLTLLRSPKMAWGGGQSPVYGGRDVFADQGEHVFDLELRGGTAPAERDLHAAARRLGQPPLVWDSTEGMDRLPWGNRPPRGLWTPAEERALADGHLPELAESRPGPGGLFAGGPGDF